MLRARPGYSCHSKLSHPDSGSPHLRGEAKPSGRWVGSCRLGSIPQVGSALLEARSWAPPGFCTAQPLTPTQAKPKRHSGLHPRALGTPPIPHHQRALREAGLRAKRAPCTRQRRCTQAQQTQRLCACSAAQSTHRRIRMHVWHNLIMRMAVHVCKCDSACGHVCECTGAHV